MALPVKGPFKRYWPVRGSKEVYAFMDLTLRLLGWKYHGNGIESGWKKGEYEYWYHDDGGISLTREP